MLDGTIDIDRVLDDGTDVISSRVAVFIVAGVLNNIPGPGREVHPSRTDIGSVLRHPLLRPIEYHCSWERFGRLSYDNVPFLALDRQAKYDGTDTGIFGVSGIFGRNRSRKSAFLNDMERPGSLRDICTVTGSEGTYSQGSVIRVERELASLVQLFFDHCNDSTGCDQVGLERELICLNISVKQIKTRPAANLHLAVHLVLLRYIPSIYVERSGIYDIVPDVRSEELKIKVLSVTLARLHRISRGLTPWIHLYVEPRHLHRLPRAGNSHHIPSRK